MWTEYTSEPTAGMRRAATILRRWNKGETDQARKALIRLAIAALKDGKADDAGKSVTVAIAGGTVTVDLFGGSITLQRA